MYIKSSTAGYSIPQINSIQIRAVMIGITILFIILTGVVSATASESDDNLSGANSVEIEPSVTIIPLTQTILVGEPFTIDVMVDPVGLSTAGLQFDLNYNSSVVTINNVTEGNFLNQNGASTLFNPGTIDNIGGNLTDVYGVIFGHVSVSTSGTFATISITANSPGFSHLNLSNVIVSNSFGYSIPVIINNGSVSIPGELSVDVAAPSTGTVNNSISFTGSATGGTGVYTAWHWEFSDGGSSDEQNPSYAYTTAGTYTVILTVTDSAGNFATATQAVTITDATALTITAPSDITEEATGALTTLYLGIPVVNNLLAIVTNDAPVTFPVGETIVTWTSTNAAGNSATVTQSVTITDTTAPVITVPADITTEATGSQTSVVIGTATATDAVDGSVSVSNDAPATFHVGETIVTWTSTDAAGNSATATQSVTITDTTAPVITIASPVDGSIVNTSQITVSGTASDDSGIASVTVNGETADGTESWSKLLTLSEGDNTITVVATDNDGNPTTRTITVKLDTTAPVIESVTLYPANTTPGATIDISMSASDNIEVVEVTADGNPLINSNGVWEGRIIAPSSLGEYALLITARDVAGNTADTSAPYRVVLREGGASISVVPGANNVIAGDTVSFNIKVKNTQNIDDVFRVHINVSELPSAYQADIIWFEWTEEVINVRSGEEVIVPMSVTIPSGVSGFKAFRAKANSIVSTTYAFGTGYLIIS